MNFNDYLKKITNVDNTNTTPANTDAMKVKPESDYTESSLFTTQEGTESGSSIFGSMSVENIEKIDMKKVLQKPEEKTETTTDNKTETKPEDKANQTEEKDDALTFTLKSFFGLDAVKKAADKDQDGTISEEEAVNYLKEVAQKDNNGNELSVEDFNKVTEELGVVFADSTETPAQTPTTDATQQTKQDTETQNTQAVTQTQAETQQPVQAQQQAVVEDSTPVQSSSSTGSISGDTESHSSNGSSSSHSSSSTSEPAKKIMTLEEMEAEKVKLEATVKEKQDAVSLINKGENDKIKSAQKEADEAKVARDKALEADGIVAEKKQLLDVEAEIATNDKSLDENTAKITELEGNLADNEQSAKALSTSLESLKSSLSGLPALSGKEEDKEKDAKIKEKKASIESQIKTKEGEVTTQNKKVEDLKKQLETLNTQKTQLETKKQELADKKTTIEQSIEKKCSEATKTAMEKYDKALENVKTVKEAELKTANEAVAEAKKAVTEITDKINKAKDEKIASENRVGGASKVEDIPDDVKERLGGKIQKLSDGSEILTFNYTKIDQMQPELVKKIADFQQVADEMGLTFVVSDGSRSVEESNRARARKGNFVCKGGQSPHNYGTAIDIALYKDGKHTSGSTMKEFASRVKAKGGITWGGDWGTYGQKYETQHFELKNWKSYKNQSNLIYKHIKTNA